MLAGGQGHCGGVQTEPLVDRPALEMGHSPQLFLLLKSLVEQKGLKWTWVSSLTVDSCPSDGPFTVTTITETLCPQTGSPELAGEPLGPG